MPIVNAHDTRCDVFVGPRPAEPNAHFGNPFSHVGHSTTKVVVESREEANRCYEAWLKGDEFQEIEPKRLLWILENLPSLKGRILGDWVYPIPSNAGVLEKLLNEWVS